jgi:predicted alpha/beta-hydrolase family hydrolase
VQGTRDVFGSREELEGYSLSPAIRVFWLEDGDHDLKPRKGVSGFSAADHMASMAREVAVWAGRLPH